ncbi:MAG: S-layer homology domain-containing protein, partial [Clostridia bacterium]
MKKVIALSLTGSMLLSTLTSTVKTSAVFDDTGAHWANDSIERWENLGILSGYDGNFGPNENITRGEVAVILDNIMGYQLSSENIFTDLGDSLYTDALLKTNQAEIILGYDGNIRPNDLITRQEMAVVICRAMHIDTTGFSGTSFADNNDISSWAMSAVACLVDSGVLVGKNGNIFAPLENMTRAELIVILDRVIDLYVNTNELYSVDVSGNVVVNTSNAVLENMHIEGDLIIAEGVAEGDVIINNVTVDGSIIVKGGGENSVYFNNVTVHGSVVVSKNDDTVRIVATGSTSVSLMEVDGDVIIVTTDLYGNTIGEVTINSGEKFELVGDFNVITNNVENADLTIDGYANKVELVEGATVNGEEYSSNVSIYDVTVDGASTDEPVQDGDYTVTVGTLTNGKLISNRSTANEGEQVVLTAIPFTGYEIDNITVLDASNNSIAVVDNRFIMPNSDVTITAIFKVQSGYNNVIISSSIDSTKGAVIVNSSLVKEGDTVSLTVVPVMSDSIDYQIDTLTVTDASGKNIEVINDKFVMPETDVTVMATFTAKVFDVVINSSSNGTVTSTPAQASKNNTVQLVATPADGYKLHTLYVIDAEGNELTVSNTNTFTMPNSKVTVSAIFIEAIGEHTITCSVPTYGTISTDVTRANAGETVTITASPYDDYDLLSITVLDGSNNEVTVVGNQFTMPDSSVTISAVFKAQIGDYFITLNESPNGTVVSSTPKADENVDVTLTLTPDTGYKVQSVVVLDTDGTEIATNTTDDVNYTFAMPDKNVSVSVLFIQDVKFYNITSTQTNGIIEFDKTQAVEGEVVTFILTPDEGYELDTITLNGVGITTGNYFVMPNTDATVDVVYKASDYSITVNPGVNGTISVQNSAKFGETVTITPTPATGYKINKYTAVDEYGRDVTVNLDGTFTMPSSNVIVTGVFTNEDYSITINSVTANGQVISSKTTAHMDDEISLVVSLDDGYKISSITAVDGSNTPITVSENNTFTMPSSNVTVTVAYELIDYKITVNSSENGTITADSTANYGENVILNITPKDGYGLQTITVLNSKSEEIEVKPDNTFVMPNSDVTIVGTFASGGVSEYAITVDTATLAGNGTVEIDKTVAKTGDTVSMIFYPNVGYELTSLKVNNDVLDVKDTSFAMGDENAVIYAEFTKINYEVIINSVDNGTVTVDKNYANLGDIVKITAKPTENSGYELHTLIVLDQYGKNVTVTDGEFVMPSGSVTVSAIFSAENYDINLSDDGNGILLTNKDVAQKGETITITPRANIGYEIDTITVLDNDNKAITVVDNSFTMPSGDVTISATFKAITYEIKVNSTLSGAVTAVNNSGTVTISYESSITKGYILHDLTVLDANGNQLTVTSDKFTMPSSKVTINATFVAEAEAEYDVTLADGITNGTILLDRVSANENDKITFIVIPTIGYELESLKIGSDVITDLSTTTFTMPAEDVTITANFEKISHYMTLNDTENGTIVTDFPTNYATYGDTVTLTPSADTGYELRSYVVLDEYGENVTVTSNSFTMPNSNVTITPIFVAKSHTITVGTIANGQVVANKTTGNYKDTVNLVVAPNSGYVLEKITINGVDHDITSDVVKNGSFTMPDGNVTISAVFEEILYSIDVNSSDNGSVTYVVNGDTVTLTATPSSGYKLYIFTVLDENGNEITVNNDGTFAMPSSDVTIDAVFVEDVTEYTVSIDSTILNGTLSVDKNIATNGETVNFITSANTGYELDTIYVNNVALNKGDTSFTLTQNSTIKAEFKAISQYITLSSTENGTISVDATNNYAILGDTVTISSTPSDGYSLHSVIVIDEYGNLVTMSGNTFVMPSSAVSISAIFTAENYNITSTNDGNGAISVNSVAKAGETVVVTAIPNSSYVLDTITVLDSDSKPITVTDNEFIMPIGDVTISATFKAINYTISVNSTVNNAVSYTVSGNTVTISYA